MSSPFSFQANTISFPIGTSAIQGTTTNDSATAGYIGEFLSTSLRSASVLALTTNTALTIVSFTLTPGDWNVWGLAGFQGGSATITRLAGGISATNNTQPTEPFLGGYAQHVIAVTAGTNSNAVIPVPDVRVSISSNTIYYLVATAIFGAQTCSAYGSIMARRMR